ncbi:MAG: helix-turn-helix transcriptional regulator [Deltaproteobacteria bacterium]|nr:helix-turn-helix transcriptional regulator [Deltaproteobacteria bacterium]
MDHDVKATEATPPQRSSTNDGTASTPTGKGKESAGGGKNTTDGSSAKAPPSGATKKKKPRKLKPNNVRKLRIDRMMSKAELARRANLSVLTIDRVEKGFGCRMNTKRKILEALGLSLEDRVRVFGEEE